MLVVCREDQRIQITARLDGRRPLTCAAVVGIPPRSKPLKCQGMDILESLDL